MHYYEDRTTKVHLNLDINDCVLMGYKSIQHKAVRVILADHNQGMLEGIRNMLENIFEVIVMVADEKSLYDSIGKVKPGLVIVDMSLPNSNEVNVIRNIREISSDVKIIILSIHDEQTVADDCLAAGASGFVLKRTAVNDLIQGIWDVLKGRTYVSDSVNNEA